MSLISLFTTSILSSNILLNKLLGVNIPFEDIKDRKEIYKIGLLTTIITTLASIVSYLLYYYILEPNNIEYLKIFLFIIIIIFVSIVCMIGVKLISPSSYESLNSYISLIMVNSSILGIILLSIQSNYKFLEVIVYSLGSGIGYMLVTYILSSLNERLGRAPIIRGFKGLPIIFITLFIMSLLFTRYIAG
jgi:electron transport complex protein RnfA